MPVVQFIYSRQRGSSGIQKQTIDIALAGSVDHRSLRDAEARCVAAFTGRFGDDYLVEWEAWSEKFTDFAHIASRQMQEIQAFVKKRGFDSPGNL
jgi:hypothetical protein